MNTGIYILFILFIFIHLLSFFFLFDTSADAQLDMNNLL